MRNPVVFLVIFLLSPGLRAQSHHDNLDAAFAQLKGNGLSPFARVLYEDSDSADNFVRRLSPLVSNAGDFFGYEIVSERRITQKITRVVIVIYFDKSPVYLRLDYYETPKGRICLPALASKEASDILPPDLIAATGK
jgi:hypothetical protein